MLADHATAVGPARLQGTVLGPPRPAHILGAFPTALYLRLNTGEVIAVLTADAVRLPLGVVLSRSSRDLPLTLVTGRVHIGASVVQIGHWRAHITRLTSVEAPTGLTPRPRALEHLWRRLAVHPSATASRALCEALAGGTRSSDAAVQAVNALMGVGPGLTPAGDDVLAGYLVGAWSFGLDATPLRTAVLEAAPTRTTDLSAALLRCASHGDSIPQLDDLLLAIADGGREESSLDSAANAVLRVGHTSGAALATGVLAAARRSLR